LSHDNTFERVQKIRLIRATVQGWVQFQMNAYIMLTRQKNSEKFKGQNCVEAAIKASW